MRFRVFRYWPTLVLSLLMAGLVIVAGTLFFVRSRELMELQIRDRLSSTAAAAALSFDGDALDAISGPVDMESDEYRSTVELLSEIRRLPDIRFAYILRRTGDPDVFSFVADGDAALTYAELDTDGNGRVDSDEEPGYPGELYDVSEVPVLRNEAFYQPAADRSITFDQWGALVSGYAPIRRSNGSVSAVLGLDMRANDFQRMAQSVFSPAALILIFFGALSIAALGSFLWNRHQIRTLRRMNGERSGLLRLTFHQLGEPLTIMKWSLETLRDETENPRLKRLVSEHVFCMDEGLGRLNSIIDVLQLAEKVDLDTIEYLPLPQSLRAVINNTVNEWSSSLAKRNQKLAVDMAEDVTLPVDKPMLSLVFRQLIVNAIEYSDNNSTITLRVRPHHHQVVFSIEDTGCGIPRKDMEHLFEKYRRSSNAHLKKPDGNGLGLYIARGIVEKAGGKMWVESVEHKGTKVFFTLPRGE